MENSVSPMTRGRLLHTPTLVTRSPLVTFTVSPGRGSILSCNLLTTESLMKECVDPVSTRAIKGTPFNLAVSFMVLPILVPVRHEERCRCPPVSHHLLRPHLLPAGKFLYWRTCDQHYTFQCNYSAISPLGCHFFTGQPQKPRALCAKGRLSVAAMRYWVSCQVFAQHHLCASFISSG